MLLRQAGTLKQSRNYFLGMGRKSHFLATGNHRRQKRLRVGGYQNYDGGWTGLFQNFQKRVLGFVSHQMSIIDNNKAAVAENRLQGQKTFSLPDLADTDGLPAGGAGCWVNT